jgi:hypothetical protein
MPTSARKTVEFLHNGSMRASTPTGRKLQLYTENRGAEPVANKLGDDNGWDEEDERD